MGRDTELRFSHCTGIIEMLMDDPTGELIIDVPETELDEYVTVLTVEIDVAPTS
jgi:hypothetical protein